jgi:Holliday junction resolvasome RuvABC endonuclease subunit
MPVRSKSSSDQPKIIMGIDPGLEGAIGFIKGNDAEVHSMPNYHIVKQAKTAKGNNKKETALDIDGIIALIKSYPVSEAYIEKQNPQPKNGVASCFRSGKMYGTLITILHMLNIRFTEIAPVTWKKAIMKDMGKEKDASIIRCKQLFPEVPLPHKGDHHKAEALLIAEYGRRS